MISLVPDSKVFYLHLYSQLFVIHQIIIIIALVLYYFYSCAIQDMSVNNCIFIGLRILNSFYNIDTQKFVTYNNINHRDILSPATNRITESLFIL